MPLTVLSVGYPLAAIKENTAGGAEHILATLDAGLVAAGERSIVLAPTGSRTAGVLLPTTPIPESLTEEVHAQACEQYKKIIERVIHDDGVDIVHMHGVDFHKYLPDAGCPVVVTLHLPPDVYPPTIFQSNRPNLHLVCVSRSQSAECPKGANLYTTIPNGVSPIHAEYPRVKGNYALCLGRICPEKGFHLAIDAATACGVPLVLAGVVFGYNSHKHYFEAVIRPRLIPPHKFVGAIGGKQKMQLLAGARCLVVPSLVNETACLAAMEALACGTPVVAFRRGALVDVIENDKTGYLVDSPEQLPGAIEATQYLSSSLCREFAEQHLSASLMVQRYLSLYRDLATHADSTLGEALQEAA